MVFFKWFFCVGLLFSPILVCANCDLIQNRNELKKDKETSLKLNQFNESVIDLWKQELLDGEVLVVQNDKVLLHLLNHDIERFGEPLFMIGSISKQFFAVTLLKALYDSSLSETEGAKVNEVKEKLHSPISRYLPKDSDIWLGHMPEWAHNVTLHHLLTHTSGIPNYTQLEEYYAPIEQEKRFCELPHSSAEMIQLVSKKELLFSPGSRFSYSNTGYHIIAVIIEEITRKTASEYIQESLFNQIGLLSTTNPSTGRYDELKLNDKYLKLVPQLKYNPKDAQKDVYLEDRFENLSNVKGDGSIISSAFDLLKWNQALHKKRSVLPDQLYTTFIVENLDGYGYGIEISDSSFGKVLNHTGSIDSYNSFLCYCPEYDLSIISLCHISCDYAKLDDEFESLYLSLEETIPDEKERIQEVRKILSEKYPKAKSRGVEKINQFISSLFKSV